MLNYYFTFLYLWGVVIFLYNLPISGLNAQLSDQLLIFFLFAFALCFAFGVSGRHQFDAKTYKKIIKTEWKPVIVLCFLFFVWFCFLGFVPAVDVLRGSKVYDDLHVSVPILPIVCLCGAVFYLVLNFHCWICGMRESLPRVFVCLLLIFCTFERGTMLVALTGCFLIIIACKKKEINIKNVLLLMALLFVVLYGFGVAGNLRSGYSWDNNNFIFSLDHIDSMPIVPDQFAWAYAYITSPLACLNFNVEEINYEMDILNFIYRFIPATIGQRLPFFSGENVVLQVPYFTVSTIWSSYYHYLGITGIYVGFLLQLVIMWLSHLMVRGTKYEFVGLVFINVMLLFSFFTNSFVYPTMSYPLLFCVILGIFEKIMKAKKVLR